MTDFQQNGYQVVRGALNRQSAKLLAGMFQLTRDHMVFFKDGNANDPKFMNDPQVENSFSWYAPLGFEVLLEEMRPKMQEITGKRLHPCYSYARIYYNGAEMARHTDRPSCQYSCTMTIEIDRNPWEIWIKGFDGVERTVDLDIGDMLVYCGDKLEHWRTPYKENYQIQAFMHYVDADGPYAGLKWDTRPLLGLGENDRDNRNSFLK
jgi:hypothetical protein